MRRREVEGLDNRSSLARTINNRRQSLYRDLGGYRSMSEQQKSLVEVVVRAKALLDAIDTRLLQRVAKGQELSPTAVNDRQRFANSYERTLKLLGIEKRKKMSSVAAVTRRIARRRQTQTPPAA